MRGLLSTDRTPTFLCDFEHGGSPDQPEQFVTQLAAFLSAAKSSLHIAIYDFRLSPGGNAYKLLVGTLRERAAAGLA